eukprot:COSAG01_NODE_2169_length_8243_cov_3.244720_6_plen_342_part_00
MVYSAEPALQMDVACPRSSFDSFRSSWISDTADGARAASSFSSDMSLGSLSGLPSLGSDFFGGDSGAGMAELVETRQRPPSPAPPLDAASTAAAGPGASVIHCYEAALQVANGFPTPPCEPSTLRGHTLRAQLNAAAPEVPPPQMMMRGQHKADGIPAAFQTADPPAAPAATLMPVSTAAAPHGCHPVAAKAFAAQCVLRPGAYPARELHKIPTPAELEQSILAIRLRIEQAAKQQSQSVCHRGQKGKGSHSIEQLMMQLKILSRDYYSKLCAYIESVNKIVAEHQRLISQRNDILPVTDGALNAKLVAPTRCVLYYFFARCSAHASWAVELSARHSLCGC